MVPKVLRSVQCVSPVVWSLPKVTWIMAACEVVIGAEEFTYQNQFLWVFGFNLIKMRIELPWKPGQDQVVEKEEAPAWLKVIRNLNEAR